MTDFTAWLFLIPEAALRFRSRRRAVASNRNTAPVDCNSSRRSEAETSRVACEARPNVSRNRSNCSAELRPRWSNCTIVMSRQSTRIRRTKPDKTAPGPTSTNVRTPCWYSCFTTWTHFTVSVIWRTRLFRTPPGVDKIVSVVLLSRGYWDSVIGNESRTCDSSRAAFSRRGV